jgi:4-hydroxybenzoate polyprenyltransferase
MDPAPTFAARTRLTSAEKVRVWLVLGRMSNLPTVWSNCIAGCWLGGWTTPGAVLLLCLGGTLLYTAGMLLNDACDVAWDIQYKRDRPIVAGLVPRRLVAVTGSGLLFGGILLLGIINQGALAFSVILAAAIVLYDLTHKRISWAPVIMAACRFLLYCTAASVGTAGITPRALLFAFALGAYVVGVSYLARTESGLHGHGRLWPLLLCVPIVAAIASKFSIATLLFAAPLFFFVGRGLALLRRNIGEAVALFLAAIILVDLLAVSPRSLVFCLTFAAMFTLTLILQKFIPST